MLVHISTCCYTKCVRARRGERESGGVEVVRFGFSVLVADELNRMIRKVENANMIRGLIKSNMLAFISG